MTGCARAAAAYSWWCSSPASSSRMVCSAYHLPDDALGAVQVPRIQLAVHVLKTLA